MCHSVLLALHRLGRCYELDPDPEPAGLSEVNLTPFCPFGAKVWHRIGIELNLNGEMDLIWNVRGAAHDDTI